VAFSQGEVQGSYRVVWRRRRERGSGRHEESDDVTITSGINHIIVHKGSA
jgi:hypothetical protein